MVSTATLFEFSMYGNAGLLLILGWIAFKTPLFEFFKAWIWRGGISVITDSGNFIRFKASKLSVKSKVYTPGVGPVNVSAPPGIEEKSKLPFYEVYAKNSYTRPKDWDPFIIQLRDDGFDFVNNSKDYANLIRLVNDPTYAESWITESENDEIKKRRRELVEKAITHEVHISPFRTYKLKNAGVWFPFNCDPVLNEISVNEEVKLQIEKKERNKNYVMTAAFILGAMVIVAVVASKFMQPAGVCPAVQAVANVVAAAPSGGFSI